MFTYCLPLTTVIIPGPAHWQFSHERQARGYPCGGLMTIKMALSLLGERAEVTRGECVAYGVKLRESRSH